MPVGQVESLHLPSEALTPIPRCQFERGGPGPPPVLHEGLTSIACPSASVVQGWDLGPGIGERSALSFHRPTGHSLLLPWVGSRQEDPDLKQRKKPC